MSDRVRWENGQTFSGIPHGQDEFRNNSRDLLPLPFIEEECGFDRTLSRSCQRRIQRRQHKQHGVNQVVSGLNKLYSGDEISKPGLQLSHGQKSSLEFIQACVQELGGPGDLCGSGALSALRVNGEYGEQPYLRPLSRPMILRSYHFRLARLVLVIWPSCGAMAGR